VEGGGRRCDGGSPGRGQDSRIRPQIHRQLLSEDEDTQGDEEPAEGLAHQVFPDVTGELAAGEAAEDGGGGERGGEGPCGGGEHRHRERGEQDPAGKRDASRQRSRPGLDPGHAAGQ
jgi:hypothetical protein